MQRQRALAGVLEQRADLRVRGVHAGNRAVRGDPGFRGGDARAGDVALGAQRVRAAAQLVRGIVEGVLAHLQFLDLGAKRLDRFALRGAAFI